MIILCAHFFGSLSRHVLGGIEEGSVHSLGYNYNLGGVDAAALELKCTEARRNPYFVHGIDATHPGLGEPVCLIHRPTNFEACTIWRTRFCHSPAIGTVPVPYIGCRVADDNIPLGRFS